MLELLEVLRCNWPSLLDSLWKGSGREEMERCGKLGLSQLLEPQESAFLAVAVVCVKSQSVFGHERLVTVGEGPAGEKKEK